MAKETTPAPARLGLYHLTLDLPLTSLTMIIEKRQAFKLDLIFLALASESGSEIDSKRFLGPLLRLRPRATRCHHHHHQ